MAKGTMRRVLSENNPAYGSAEGMINRAVSEQNNIRALSDLQKKIYSKAGKKFWEDWEEGLKIAEKLAGKALLDFEKTKQQKRDEEHADRLEDLRIEYELASELDKKRYEKQIKDEKKAYDKQVTREKELTNIKNNAVKALKSAVNDINSGVNNFLSSYGQYFSSITTRLLGSGKSYTSASKIISNALGGTPLVKQTAVLEKLNTLVAQGIAYNVEQRAFLDTVKDKIATTFDAANGTLLQLIKIQQADSTAARLGLESSLNNFFNKNFLDTSYLNSLSDSVAASILGANSQLSRDGSVAFEYVVQKWLGSMSSVGVSDSTIQSLAAGLNALGTGDVDYLNGNTSLQNLLVMAANNAGLNYSSLLTGGLNATTANELLSGVISYGRSIAQSNNQVVKAQYANLFGMTVADLTALLNLSSSDLISISNNMLDYSQSIAKTESELSKLSSRTSISDLVLNTVDNVLTSVNLGIANSAAQTTTWLLADYVEKLTGGINIPAVFGMGTGVDLNATVTGLIKTGLVGYNVIAKASSVLGNIFKGNGLNLNNWGADETILGRGRGLSTTISEGNYARTTSQTAFVGNADESAIYAGTVTSAQDKASESITSQEPSKLELTIIEDIAPNVYNIYAILSNWNTNGIPDNSIFPGTRG